MRLLVVDDDPGIVNILSISLKESSYDVDEANDGVEAVELLQKNSYDVAIIDAIMPKMNGAEVCNFIKSHYPHIYVIGISGYPQSLEKLKNEGADICFTKPFSVVQINRAIKNHFTSPLPNS
ncbi:MAG TPA: response regulator [Syntrophales bacterium]|nr:response regulator [Syntrophales bacterium]